ncbi:osmotically-inducible protein OsmY [Anaerosolibacter carboniphilus]|uniref:Osmotically-inducible protein OsmY n=1 Tax=Anaerosolibacter carboniphilus TaxID=1417629 RepID=A0A841KNZ9_9FIRM|nr:BON domain-containing protein [Anaerosolibacter carboniphilus]MBB6215133.1 osmotically-inducible protein OsmY [Anaerosolibacter carboniphilus]
MDEKRKNKIKNDKLPGKDDLIVDLAKDQLEEKMQASAMDINLFCKDGYVHMYGMVDVLAEKKMAESVVKSIDGVRKIENKITVAMDSNITDKHMEKEVLNRLMNGQRSEDLVGVSVKVEDGVANLIGNTKTLMDAHTAMSVASEVRGIKDVVNNIEVSDDVAYDDATLNSRVTQALSTTALNYPDIIHTVVHGRVTLNGFVNSRHEMEMAKEIAMGVEGVRKVVNRLKVRRENEDKEEI